MEFNQDNRTFRTPITVLDTVAEQLADIDLTLPDYCPDIEKILKCTLIPKIQSKTLSGGQLQVDGYCVVNVLYVESVGKTIRCCEQSVNFSQSFSVHDTGDSCVVLTKTKSEYINCRALSPRRLVMHGAFSLYVKVICSDKTELFTPEQDNLELNTMSLKLCNLKSMCQEQFTLSEEISVADKPAIESVLYSSVKASVSDAKAVSGKLMLNGELNLKLFYLTNIETGETAKLDYILPFNQIIDCEGIGEDTENLLDCEVMSYDIRLKNDILSDKPAIALDAKLCVTEEAYACDDTDVVIDAYSTEFASAPQFTQLQSIGEVCNVNDTFIEKLTAKVDNCKISKILNIYTDFVTVDTTATSDGLKASGKINLCILALGENNFPIFIERSCDFDHILASAPECNGMIFENASITSISYRLADDNSIDIRIELKISGGAVKNQTTKAVSAVEVFEDKPIVSDNCALTLYFASDGENLWDIAKSHNTRLNLLLAENALEEMTLDGAKMLLIPKI